LAIFRWFSHIPVIMSVATEKSNDRKNTWRLSEIILELMSLETKPLLLSNCIQDFESILEILLISLVIFPVYEHTALVRFLAICQTFWNDISVIVFIISVNVTKLTPCNLFWSPPHHHEFKLMWIPQTLFTIVVLSLLITAMDTVIAYV